MDALSPPVWLPLWCVSEHWLSGAARGTGPLSRSRDAVLAVSALPAPLTSVPLSASVAVSAGSRSHRVSPADSQATEVNSECTSSSGLSTLVSPMGSRAAPSLADTEMYASSVADTELYASSLTHSEEYPPWDYQ